MSAQIHKILIVEDNPDRVTVFFNMFESHNLTITNNVDIAISLLKTIKFDVVFLDHDLGPSSFIDIECTQYVKSGLDVVKTIMNSVNMTSRFIIHSWNDIGAKNMESYLEQSCPESIVEIRKFGDFNKDILNKDGVLTKYFEGD